MLFNNKRNELLVHAATWINYKIKEARHKRLHVT